MTPSEMVTNYFKEEFEREVLLKEYGFASYKILGSECLVGDIFVDPYFRKMGLGQELGKELEKVAKNNGCSYMSCIITMDHERVDFFNRKVKIFGLAGYKIVRAVNNQLILVKEI